MKTAVTHMASGVTVISGWERSLVLYQSLSLSTSPWRKRDIRSGYEKTRDWGTAIGGLVAASALLVSDSKHRTQWLAAGGALAGTTNLLSAAFGQRVSRAYSENMVFLDMSVRAYDDLKAHQARLNKAADNAEMVLKVDIVKVATVLGDKNVNEDDKLALLPDVLQLVDQYQASVRQLIEINADVQQLASRALLALSVPTSADTPELKQIRDDLRQVADGAKAWGVKYAKTVYEFFNLSASTRASLTAAEVSIKSAAPVPPTRNSGGAGTH